MAITSYSTLSSELNTFTVRSYSQAQIDTFIGLAEAEFNLYLGPNYARETTATIATNSSGVASLPAGFVRFISASHATYGNLTLVAPEVLVAFNPDGSSGTPSMVAIQGSSLLTADAFEGDIILNYEARLSGLNSTTTTNWLLAKAPQAYLKMVMAFAAEFQEEWDKARGMKAAALQTLSDLGIQSMVAQYGRASLRMRTPTP